MRKLITTIILCSLAAFSLGAKQYAVVSPDGSLCIKVTDGSQLAWSVTKNGETVMEYSAISLDLKGKGVLGVDCKFGQPERVYRSDILTATVPTKNREIRDCYNQM
ncbi:MAG: glycoside hydrolase family 97 N-terminal domain-containing protein, partial [Bacteroidales bacterium]|nr:glycoside hydrolase family 97 N-terminal domain-containing protein [Bacteroidales bacterium]